MDKRGLLIKLLIYMVSAIICSGICLLILFNILPLTYSSIILMYMPIGISFVINYLYNFNNNEVE